MRGRNWRKICGILGRAAILGMARVQVKDGGSGGGGRDRRDSAIAAGVAGQVGRHRRRVDGAGDGTGDDDLAFRCHVTLVKNPFRARRSSASTLPQTEIAWPEMPLPPGEHRKSAVAATSSGVVMQRSEIFAEILLLHLLVQQAELRGARPEHAHQARTHDDARLNSVNANVGWPEFDGETLGEPDDRPTSTAASGVRYA